MRLDAVGFETNAPECEVDLVQTGGAGAGATNGITTGSARSGTRRYEVSRPTQGQPSLEFAQWNLPTGNAPSTLTTFLALKVSGISAEALIWNHLTVLGITVGLVIAPVDAGHFDLFARIAVPPAPAIDGVHLLLPYGEWVPMRTRVELPVDLTSASDLVRVETPVGTSEAVASIAIPVVTALQLGITTLTTIGFNVSIDDLIVDDVSNAVIPLSTRLHYLEPNAAGSASDGAVQGTGSAITAWSDNADGTTVQFTELLPLPTGPGTRTLNTVNMPGAQPVNVAIPAVYVSLRSGGLLDFVGDLVLGSRAFVVTALNGVFRFHPRLIGSILNILGIGDIQPTTHRSLGINTNRPDTLGPWTEAAVDAVEIGASLQAGGVVDVFTVEKVWGYAEYSVSSSPAQATEGATNFDTGQKQAHPTATATEGASTRSTDTATRNPDSAHLTQGASVFAPNSASVIESAAVLTGAATSRGVGASTREPLSASAIGGATARGDVSSTSRFPQSAPATGAAMTTGNDTTTRSVTSSFATDGGFGDVPIVEKRTMLSGALATAGGVLRALRIRLREDGGLATVGALIRSFAVRGSNRGDCDVTETPSERGCEVELAPTDRSCEVEATPTLRRP